MKFTQRDKDILAHLLNVKYDDDSVIGDAELRVLLNKFYDWTNHPEYKFNEKDDYYEAEQ